MSEAPQKRTRLKEGDEHYIENARLTKVLTEYADKFQAEMDLVWKDFPDMKRKEVKMRVFTEDRVPMNNELAGYIMLIAERLCTKHQFSRYTYRPDMESDAVMTMLKACPNFKGKFGEENNTPPNGFAYLSMVAYSAIINRIKIETSEADAIDELILNLGTEYLDDPDVGDLVKKLQGDISERQNAKKDNKSIKPTFQIRNRDNFKDKK